jgi:serine/threonine-protein kinase HipA
MIRLRVWANARPMGWLGHEAGVYFFEYDAQWLEQHGGFVLAPGFPLRPERYTGEGVRTFFANLLPEGAALEDILNAIQSRDASPFEMVGRLGAELPGVLSVLPEGQAPSIAQQYEPLTHQQLSQRLTERGEKPLLLSNPQATMSLAGAQDKIGLRFDARTGRISDSVGASPTTHIFKPDTRLKAFQPSAINEYACMTLARAVKLPVPRVWLLRVPEAVYVVERYDRVMVAGNILGLHQIDGCQLLQVGADWKYQRNAGLVSLPKLVAALRGLPVTGRDLLELQRWVMFNYLIGNSDAHAKNMSVLIDDAGYRLAPFYDLLCVQAYGDNRLALFIGDEEEFGAVGAHSWEAFCKDCGFRYAQTMDEFRKMAVAVVKAWAKVRDGISSDAKTTPEERQLVQRMDGVIHANAQAALSMTG